MEKLFACLAASALLAGPAAAQDVVLFKAKVAAQDFQNGIDIPQDGERVVLIEGGVYRLRLAVDDVLIGDVAERNVVTTAFVQGEFRADPPRVLYVLARRTARGGYETIAWDFADQGLCMAQDWNALGIEAEWRTQAQIHPCTLNTPPRS